MNLTRMAALLGLALTTSGAHEPQFTTPYAPGPLVLPTDAPTGYQPTDAPTGYQPTDAPTGHQPRVKVGAATRIDWTFCVSTRSLAQPPESWLPPDYDSRKQLYELFVPSDYDPRQTYAVVLFISAGTGPAGWAEWQPTCQEQRIIFASPYGAGNNIPAAQRCRIVLDVLDDVRRNYRTDPDRTYLSGFSGGGRVAGRIAFSLPEHFGGVVSVGSSGEFRTEEWLRQRLIDRFSVALVTGEKDFNRGECELYKGPWLSEVGVRAKVWVVPGQGHAIPGDGQFAEVFQWLEDDLPRRRELAKKFPGTRIAGDAAGSRDERSNALLAEGKQRLEAKKTVSSGLLLLRGCVVRFDGLPAAAAALRIVAEYEARSEKPWDEERNNERRHFTYGKALGLTRYATSDLLRDPSQRRTMAGEALQLWEALLKDEKYPRGVAEAKKRIPELRQIAGARE
jgi:pimeloyl-ACP methyl ester carboxylesterase